MAADKQVSAASRRRKRLSGWVLSQFQVTLAVCGIVVGFLVCFGLGFLSGVWFQTQEQMLPHDDAITLADNQLDRERKASGREMTFYSTLTSRDGTSEPELQPRSPATPAVSSEMASPSPSSDSQMRKSANQDATEVKGAEKTSAGHLRTAASSMSTASASQAATPTTSKSKGTASVALPNPPEALFYSVQVGSFRKVEQAYRLQDQLIKKGYQARIGLSIVEGKGAWYRVRVGRYADRGSANKTAQRLQNIENIDVLVMRVSS